MGYSEELWGWEAWKRRLLAFIFLMAAICLTMLPLWQDIGIQPTLWLVVLYHWAIYRSNLLSIDQLILISLIQDGIYAYPLGFSALRLLIGYAFLASQKQILGHQRFLWVWGGFGVFVLLDSLVYGILLSCVKYEWIGILPLVPGMLMTVCFYPLGVGVMNRLIEKRLFS